jgi:mRNA-degrading endonuclease RelE of RelBE toxin-antitoxin system
MDIKVFRTPTFIKKEKRLKPNQLKDLDQAVRFIVNNPECGEQKRGDLSDVWVYKFRMTNQLTLLAYSWDPSKRILIALGVHENFYRDLNKNK